MSGVTKPELLERLACPACGGDYKTVTASKLICSGCGKKIHLLHDKPVFTSIPPGMRAAPKLVRGPDEGSSWRRANWRFLEATIKSLPKEAVILDFGAGHGDFSEILGKHATIALDVFPYDEIDVVCDLEKKIPFKKDSFDAIVLMNVLEHIPQPEKLMKTLASLLRPAGLLIVAVPFLLKLHQLPYDFFRYSHYQLENMGCEAKLEMVKLEGYYDPALLFRESAQNIRSFVLPGLPSIRRKPSRLLVEAISACVSGLQRLIGYGYVRNPKNEKSLYPIGYHVIYKAGSKKRKN
ncbi:MAG: class I SAM-dependent methyltransferase [Anaerolineaceae bacterium]